LAQPLLRDLIECPPLLAAAAATARTCFLTLIIAEQVQLLRSSRAAMCRGNTRLDIFLSCNYKTIECASSLERVHVVVRIIAVQV